MVIPNTSKIKGMIHENINNGSYRPGPGTGTDPNCWYCNNPDSKIREKWTAHNDGLFRVNGMLKKTGSDNATIGSGINYSNYGDLHNNIYLCDMRGYTVTENPDGGRTISTNGAGITDNYFQNTVGAYFIYIYSPSNNLLHDSNEGKDGYYGQVLLGGVICKDFQAVNESGKFKFVYAKPASYYAPGNQSFNGNDFVYMVDKLVYPPPLDTGDPSGFSYTKYDVKDLPYYN
jgi:hypothetical protein